MVDLSRDQDAPSDDEALLDPSEAAEIIPDDPDHPMESDDNDDPEADAAQEQEEIQLQNDSLAHFDHHTDSIFCIANHPLAPTTIATGGGDDTTYVFSADIPSPVLPPSYESSPPTSRSSIQPIAKLTGHTDSINALAYTLPHGEYLLTGGLDGQLRVHSTTDPSYPLVTSTQEVPEINFLAPTPHPSHANAFALGASDGSVWVYTMDPSSDPANPLQVLQAYYLHTESCTAGAWTPDGKLLATVSEDGSLYVWDPFGEAAAAGITSPSSSSGSQALVGLTSADQRFAVEDGLFSIAIAASGALAAVGGAHGMIRVVGLPRLGTASASSSSTTKSLKGSGAAGKPKGGRQTGGPSSTGSNASGSSSAGQAGAILASLQTQSESIETLAFSPEHSSLLAAGSVDGSVCLFDAAHRFALRRHIREAHEGYAVVKVAFGSGRFAAPWASQQASSGSDGGGVDSSTRDEDAPASWFLTSCGMDGVVRRWDCRGGTGRGGAGPAVQQQQQQQGLVKEWRGHRGEGEGGGVLGFVMITPGSAGAAAAATQVGAVVVTAGDDGVSLVFG
ncbi:MAG: hypothetical protein LQ344_006538 [Seirophora lacunosa]|nr:MAG: hypothetical protein LQ344_006538 [Seirophora lacunosa]